MEDDERALPRFAERLKSLRGKESRVSFAHRIGESDSTLGNYERGTRIPQADFLARLKDATGVDLNWLVSGGSNPPPPTWMTAAGLPEGFVPIKRLEVRASAGGGLVALSDTMLDEPPEVPFRLEWLRRLGVSQTNAVFLVADGDSMADTIMHGDLILLDRGIDQVRSDGIYVLTYNGEVKVKRVQVLRSGIVLLKSDNPNYQTEEVPAHEVPDLQIEGRVRWAGGAV